MEESNQKRLESTGWKIGSAEEFLNSFDFENEVQKNITIAKNCSLKLKRTFSGKWKILGKRFNKRHLAVKYYFKQSGIF